MLNTYFYPKMKYTKNEVSFMYVFFENGDFLEIKGSEIINFSINVYDKLIRSHKGYNPVVASGYFKLKICNKPKFVQSSHSLYNDADFKKDRKSYIENRCTNESRITEIWLFNSNNWHKVLHCELKAKMDGDFLLFEFIPQPQMGAYQSENHYVNVGNVKKEDIHHIDLDFENCESFVVYNDEIEEVNINFDDQLKWGSGDLCRKALGGYIKIKLDKGFLPRQNCLFGNEKGLKNIDFERRLCGKKGEDIHDICHLYIDYYHAGYGGIQASECVEVDDAKTAEELEELEKKEEQTGETYYYYEGGYCKKTKDGSIIIAFGISAKNTINKMFNN